MRTFFNGFLLGIIVSAGAVWFYVSTYPMPTVHEARQRTTAEAGNAPAPAQAMAEQAKPALPETLDALELRADDIRKEIAETGRVERRRARDLGDAVADATTDARITAAVKAKLAADPDLSVQTVVSTLQAK